MKLIYFCMNSWLPPFVGQLFARFMLDPSHAKELLLGNPERESPERSEPKNSEAVPFRLFFPDSIQYRFTNLVNIQLASPDRPPPESHSPEPDETADDCKTGNNSPAAPPPPSDPDSRAGKSPRI